MTGVDILLHINLSPIMWYAPSSTARLLIEFYVDKETGALCDYEVQYRVCTRSGVLFVLYSINDSTSEIFNCIEVIRSFNYFCNDK